ncbi:MAG: DUF4012 domain-containing protein [Candidatus Kerfeldbacteria bacterium]|nr:DUF4012 domain-containing protein [Candidatus Kerfeldbacteria bacterium]
MKFSFSFRHRRTRLLRLTAWIARHPLTTRLIGLVTAATVLTIATFTPIQSAIEHGRAARRSLTQAQSALTKQDFSAALAAAQRTATELAAVDRAIGKLRALRPIPGVGTQLEAVTVLTDVARQLVAAMHDGTLAGDQIFGPLKHGQGSISLAQLTPADKRAILERIATAGPQLESVRDHVQLAAGRFRDLPTRGVIRPLHAAIAPLREQIPFLEQVAQQLIPATRIIPAVAGFPNAKTYLFLLQNNSELRPTGGFIGTYGILKVSAGEITSFTTSDVYTLDKPVADSLRIEPPTPLRRYNNATQWFFRDANWSPDFPTAAQQALEFYRFENGPQRNLDGVIAVTPTFVSSLLAISGDITVDGITFTTENLVDRLQPLADRKELIGEMSKILLNRLLALPQRRWQEMIVALTTALEEKRMLLYASDAELQEQIIAQNWGGDIRPAPIDSIFVVDANLASLKTDQVVDRAIDYQLTFDNGQARATVTITYANRGSFTRTTTRYRTYTRVYVPPGSTLVSSSGAMRNDKLRGGGVGTVDRSEELSRTVFGAFISIEPGNSGTLSFTYTLPASVSQSIDRGRYELYLQKQPGTMAHRLTSSLEFARPVELISGVDGAKKIGQNKISLTSNLRVDRHLVVSFK